VSGPPPPPPAVVAAEGDPAGGWSRLHPLTPLLRGGRLILVVLALAGQQGLRSASPEAVAVGLGVGLPLAVFAGWLAWRRMRYRLTGTELQVESGILTTRSRRVPLARLQSVDVVRPLLARLLGLAELRMEVVGGGAGAEAPLSYLSEDDAEALRARLLHLASGGADEVAAREAPPHVLVVVPPGPLVWSTVLGAPAQALAGLLVVLAVVGAVDLSYLPGVLLGAAPLLFGVGSFAVRRVLTEYGFTVAEAGDGLRLQQGLLDKRSSTIPPGRVQTIRVLQPLTWRPFGWVRVEVDVAGYGAGGGAEQQLTTGALLPVAPRELAERLVARVLGGTLPVPDRLPPPAARLRAPVLHRRLALGLDDRHLVSAYGVATTTTDVVPLAKVQSLRLTQGPWQRRLGLCSLHVDTAGRRLPGTVALHRGELEGRQLLADLARRARAARAGTGSAGA
jgi:putative membrane protein